MADFMLNFYVSSLGIVVLGVAALYMARGGRNCHYVRETYVAIGLYLIVAGLIRIGGEAFSVDPTFSRTITGWLAFCCAVGSVITTFNHWMFHRFLREARG